MIGANENEFSILRIPRKYMNYLSQTSVEECKLYSNNVYEVRKYIYIYIY